MERVKIKPKFSFVRLDLKWRMRQIHVTVTTEDERLRDFYTLHPQSDGSSDIARVYHTLIKKIIKFSSYIGNPDGTGWKVIYEEGLPTI